MSLPSTFKTSRQRRSLEEAQRNMEIAVMGTYRKQFETKRQIRNALADLAAERAEKSLDYLEQP
ncbi:hypothetical protein HZU75_00270 [Chitinibacter fontanus]|uniref:Uncharacterized protein n=1 Tax=Chitinibacter fontanus TaxID=1737446 RepID=A0A7D5V6F2_9NEIS|nr:hypothetical protein [Chitinibacter fontanus]QLI80097.1 hypothetical protein HZU75_00270 [Chitinibacter fontanus]